MKGIGWVALRSPQIENVKKAGELISEVLINLSWDGTTVGIVYHQGSLLHDTYGCSLAFPFDVGACLYNRCTLPKSST